MIQSVSHLPRPLLLLALIAGLPFRGAVGPAAHAQARTHAGAERSDAKADAEVSELNARIADANAARAAGDPIAIRSASQRLVAAALREMAELRMVEAAFPQAAELYSKAPRSRWLRRNMGRSRTCRAAGREAG